MNMSTHRIDGLVSHLWSRRTLLPERSRTSVPCRGSQRSSHPTDHDDDNNGDDDDDDSDDDSDDDYRNEDDDDSDDDGWWWG